MVGDHLSALTAAVCVAIAAAALVVGGLELCRHPHYILGLEALALVGSAQSADP
ncbi:hypothetical protein AB0346_00770 [Nocardia beijingensis]|uniref:hypothetical protein n=1 Tax=Nocardia beijingensis TaxID=95162 RepID=UPI00344F2B72